MDCDNPLLGSRVPYNHQATRVLNTAQKRTSVTCPAGLLKSLNNKQCTVALLVLDASKSRFHDGYCAPSRCTLRSTNNQAWLKHCATFDFRLARVSAIDFCLTWRDTKSLLASNVARNFDAFFPCSHLSDTSGFGPPQIEAGMLAFPRARLTCSTCVSKMPNVCLMQNLPALTVKVGTSLFLQVQIGSNRLSLQGRQKSPPA